MQISHIKSRYFKKLLLSFTILFLLAFFLNPVIAEDRYLHYDEQAITPNTWQQVDIVYYDDFESPSS